MPFDGFTHWTSEQETANAPGPKPSVRRAWTIVFLVALLLSGIIAKTHGSQGYRATNASRSYSATGIVTAWPRPPNGGSGRNAVALSGDGGRVEPGGPERAGRKDYDLVTTYTGTDVQNLTYGYDYAGNLTSITDNLAGGRDESYGVDDLNRLHTASGAYGSRTYTYDNNSNRATWYDGSTTKTSHYNSGTNIPGTITFGSSTRTLTWTGSGNMASDDRVGANGLATSYTYGGRNRLESMSVNSQPITFKINALGERVSKATVGGTTHYHYDLAHRIIAESDGSSGANTMEYVYMDGIPLAQIDSSGNIFYIYPNQLNAPQKMANASRTLVWDREQEPFGEDYATPTNTTPTNHRFPGQYADVEDSLSYNLNRDYDPTLGRYVQADPLGFGGGANLYGYVGQNPTQGIDSSGLNEEKKDLASVGVISPGAGGPSQIPDATGGGVGIGESQASAEAALAETPAVAQGAEVNTGALETDCPNSNVSDSGSTSLYHGTDAESAADILNNGLNMGAAGEYGGGDVFWTTTSSSDAGIFAETNPAEGEPAVLHIAVPNPVLDSLQSGKLLTIKGPVYQFEPEAVDSLNANAKIELVK